jgi:hypothetical protein
MELTLPSAAFGAYGVLKLADEHWERFINLGGGAPITPSSSLQIFLQGCSGEVYFPKSIISGNYIYSLNGSGQLVRYVLSTLSLDNSFTPVYDVKDMRAVSGSGGVMLLRGDGSVDFVGGASDPFANSAVGKISSGAIGIVSNRYTSQVGVLKSDGTLVFQNGYSDVKVSGASYNFVAISDAKGNNYDRRGFFHAITQGGEVYGASYPDGTLREISLNTTLSAGDDIATAQFFSYGDYSIVLKNGRIYDPDFNPDADFAGLYSQVCSGSGYVIALRADGVVVCKGDSPPSIPFGYNHSFISVRDGCFTRTDGSQFIYSAAKGQNIPEDLKIPLFARKSSPSIRYAGSFYDLAEAAEVSFGPAVSPGFRPQAFAVASNVPSSSLVAGNWYQIAVSGTTSWTGAGASSNSVGTIFKATTARSGTGTANLLKSEFSDVGQYELLSSDYSYSLENVVLTITPGVPVIENPTAAGKVGVAFSKSFLTNGTNRPVTSWSAAGLPAWASLNSSTGVISGTPQDAGDYQFQLTASSSVGSDTEQVTISVAVGAATVLAGQSFTGKVGEAFSAQVAMDDVVDRPATSWAAGSLPTGLSINSTTGEISGIPTSKGSKVASISASGPGGSSPPASVSFAIAEGVPIITAGQVLRGWAEAALVKSPALTDSANRPATSWSALGLPEWAALDAGTGVITGSPQESDIYSIVVTAEGPGGLDTETVQIKIDPVFVANFSGECSLGVAWDSRLVVVFSSEGTLDAHLSEGPQLVVVFSGEATLDAHLFGADSVFVDFQSAGFLEAGESWLLYRDFEPSLQGVSSMDGKFIARDLQRFAWGEFDLAKDFRGEIYLHCYTTSHGRMTPAPLIKAGVKLFNSRVESEAYREVEGAEGRPFDLELQAAAGVLNGVVPVTQSRVRAVYNIWAMQVPPPESQVHLSIYLKRQGSDCAAKLEEVADSGWPAGNAREVKYAEWDLCGDLPPRCQPAASGWSPATNAAPYPFMFLQTNASAPGCLPASRLERGNGIDSEDINFARGEIEQEIVIDESHCVTPWSPDPVTICYGAVFTQSTCDCCSEEAGCETTIRSAVGTKPLVWSGWTPSAATYCPSVSVNQSRYELNGCAEDQSQTVPGTQAVGAWGAWGPLAASVCQGVSFQQSRVDASGCSAPQTQSATGTKQPSWGAWLPLPSDVCSGETFQQTRQDQNGCLAPQTQSATGTKACQCSNSVSDETVYCKGSRFTCCGNGYVHTKRGCVYIGPAGYCGDPANQK